MTAPPSQATEIGFAEDHPTAAGHFPGNPVIPGALLLDAVLRAVAGAAPAPSCAIRTAKFLRPVRPGDRLRIEWQWRGNDAQFRCALPTGDVAVTGVLRLGDSPE